MTQSEGALERMFQHQTEMQIRSFGGVNPKDLGLEEKIQFLKDMTLALEDELHESMQEYGWKPWSTRRYIDVEPLKGELVDAWHFFMNLCIAVGLTPEELTHRYFNKAAVNKARQEAGYDNTNKCATCRRALDEPEHPAPSEAESENRLLNEDYVREMLEDERSRHVPTTVTTPTPQGIQGVVYPPGVTPKHNHQTRIILAPGKCPACDFTHHAEAQRKYAMDEKEKPLAEEPAETEDEKIRRVFVSEVLAAARAQIDGAGGEDPPVIEIALEHLSSLEQYITLDPDTTADAPGGVFFSSPDDQGEATDD